MAEYTIFCKVEATVTFTVNADSIDEATTKGLDWMDGERPVVNGVVEND